MLRLFKLFDMAAPITTFPIAVKRVPELPPLTIPLDDDLLVIWKDADNTTYYIAVSNLRSYFQQVNAEQQGGIVSTATAYLSLSAAQIKTANSIHIDIGLPASGAGYYYKVVSFDNKYTKSTTDFTTTDLRIGPTSLTNGYQATNTAIAQTSSSFRTGIISSPADNISDNDTISIWADADSAVGDGSVECYIVIQKIKL